MSNDFYTATGTPATRSQGSSSNMRGEFNAILAAFDKMPGLAGNALKAVRVNSGATGLEAVAVTGTGSAVFNTSPTLVTPVLGAASASSIAVSGQITSTLATGTPPLVVASASLVANLYAARAALADTVTSNANLSGPITSIGNVTAVGSQTGTGSKFVMDTSPVLVTPNIGVATATSINGVGYTGAAGKTLTVSNSITIAGTDGSTLNVGTGGTLGSAAFTASSAYASVAAATSAFAGTGGTMNGITIGGTTPAPATFTHVVVKKTAYSPTLNAAVAVDWTNGSGAIVTSGSHVVSFTNIPAADFASLFLFVDNFNNIGTWPAAVDWGVAGKPSIAGAAYVSFATTNGGASIPAAIFNRDA